MGSSRFTPRRRRQDDVADVLSAARRRILRYLERRGILAPVAIPGDGEMGVAGEDALAEKDPLLARLLASAVAGVPPAGPARKLAPIVLVTRGAAGAAPRQTGRLTADLGGFSLHAATHVHAHDTRGREAICRYILRPPLANERVSNLPDGRVRITLKKPFRDGTTAVELAPLAFMARLAAIIPGPRLHVFRYHGLLAPRSRHRAEVVPGRRPTCDVTAGDSAVAESGESATAHTPATEDKAAAKVSAGRRGRYMPWAELLKRTWKVDVLHCEKCGGRLKLVAMVTHLSLYACAAGHAVRFVTLETAVGHRPGGGPYSVGRWQL